MEIGADGTVSVIPLGQEATTLVVIDRIKLVNPDIKQVYKGNDGLMYLQNGAQAVADANIKVESGVVESSNVNIVDAMTNMIDIARNYEMQSKLMKKAEEMDSTSSKLLSLS